MLSVALVVLLAVLIGRHFEKGLVISQQLLRQAETETERALFFAELRAAREEAEGCCHLVENRDRSREQVDRLLESARAARAARASEIGWGPQTGNHHIDPDADDRMIADRSFVGETEYTRSLTEPTEPDEPQTDGLVRTPTRKPPSPR